MKFKGTDGPVYLTNDTKILFFEIGEGLYIGKIVICLAAGYNLYTNDTLEEVVKIIQQGYEDWLAGKIL